MSTAMLSIVRGMEEDVEELVNLIIEECRPNVPWVEEASQDLLDELQVRVRMTVLAILSRLRDEEPPGEFLNHLSKVGRYFAERGFPLHDDLLGFQIGTKVLWRAAIERAPDDPAERAEALAVVGEVILKVIQEATSTFAAAYQEGAAARAADGEYDLQILVEVLAGERAPDDSMIQRAQRWGIDLSSLRWCVAIEVAPEDAGEMVRVVRRSYPAGAAARLSRHVVAYLPGKEIPRLGGVPGVGIAQSPPTDEAARQARAASRLARELGMEQALFDDVMPLASALSASPESRESFIRARLGSIFDEPSDGGLLETLEAYLVDRSPTKAARRLFIHRHTVQYRICRIEELLGVKLDDPLTRCLLEVALLMHRAGSRDPA